MHWINVQGKTRWRFKLRRKLPMGRYVIYSRAVDVQGLAESRFSRKLQNRRDFRLR